MEGGHKEKKEKEIRQKRQEAIWKSPLDGWHKANFDGAAKGNPTPVGCGGIIRNCFGVEVATVSHPLGKQTNHYAKASVALHTTRLAKDIRVRNLWLEGDSNNIV